MAPSKDRVIPRALKLMNITIILKKGLCRCDSIKAGEIILD